MNISRHRKKTTLTNQPQNTGNSPRLPPEELLLRRALSTRTTLWPGERVEISFTRRSFKGKLNVVRALVRFSCVTRVEMVRLYSFVSWFYVAFVRVLLSVKKRGLGRWLRKIQMIRVQILQLFQQIKKLNSLPYPVKIVTLNPQSQGSCTKFQ